MVPAFIGFLFNKNKCPVFDPGKVRIFKIGNSQQTVNCTRKKRLVESKKKLKKLFFLPTQARGRLTLNQTDSDIVFVEN